MSLLPSNEEKELHIFDEALEAIYNKDDIVFNPLLPLTAKAELLPYLAKQYDLNISIYDEKERELISKGLWIKAKIGTVGAIKRALEIVGNDVVVEEWFQYGADPFRFRIHLSITEGEITEQIKERIVSIIHINKNVRSILDELILSYQVKHSQNIKLGGIGEVSIGSKMLEGYEETLNGLQNISIGAVGETSSYALMKMEVEK